MIWQTAYGPGFPGWHIECSAMSLHYLQGHVDLHIGGIDLRFPHHENERAQSNPLVKGEAVSAWLHGEHLLFEGRKMSKSSGNVVLLSDVITRGFDPLSLRFCFLENRYRSQMDLSWNSISAAHSTLQRLRAKYQQWKLAPKDYSDEASAFVLAILAKLTRCRPSSRMSVVASLHSSGNRSSSRHWPPSVSLRCCPRGIWICQLLSSSKLPGVLKR